MSGGPLLRFESVSKAYRTPDGELRALDDVSFSLAAGESVAIIGPNGAGKSTLLRVASGIAPPTSGTVVRSARTSTLIELGAGFEPELTGWENLRFALALHGLSARRQRERIDDVVELSGIEEALDTPVKWYSSGMRARLAVAVALNADPDLLLIDEVLAVGDFAFQRVVLQRVRALLAEGAALALVTHDPFLATAAAERSLWIDHGAVVRDGPAPTVVAEYGRVNGVTRPPAPWQHTRVTELRISPDPIRAHVPVVVEASLERAPDAPAARLRLEMLPPRDTEADVWWSRGDKEPLALRTVNVFGDTADHLLDPAGATELQVRFSFEEMPITPPAAELALVVLDAEADQVVDEAFQAVGTEEPTLDTPVMLDIAVSDQRFEELPAGPLPPRDGTV